MADQDCQDINIFLKEFSLEMFIEKPKQNCTLEQGEAHYENMRIQDEYQAQDKTDEKFENYISKEIPECYNSDLDIKDDGLLFFKDLLEKGTTCNAFGIAEAKQGSWTDAIEQWKKALNYRRRVFGYMHPEVADTISNIGIALGKIGEDDVAMINLQKALKIRVELGECHKDIASSYHNIGNLERERGNYNVSEEYFNESLRIKKKLFGKIHIEVAIAFNSIGHVYYDCQIYSKALKFYEKSYIIYREFGLSETHPYVVQVLLDLNDAEALHSLTSD